MTKRLSKMLGVLLAAMLALAAFALPALAYEVHPDGTITFEDGSNPTGYKITFDMPQGVTFEESGGVWADWVRDAYEVPNPAATATNGIDYYCWADKASAFSFDIPEDYILEDVLIVPDTAGEVVEADASGFVMVKLTAPATLKLALGQVNYDHTYTDPTTGVSITLSSVEAKKVEGETFYARKLADFDEVGYVQSAIQKAINDLPAAEQYSPTGLAAYDTTFSMDADPFFPTAYVGWNQYPFYVSIPLPAGWNTTDIHAYHYWAEPGGGEYASASEREWTISADGKSVIIKENFGAFYGRYCLVYSGEIAPTHAPGWAKENGGYYYYENDGTLRKNAWISYAGSWYYLGADGKLVVNGWAPYQGKNYYMGSNGKVTTNAWVKDSATGKYYYMNGSGQPTVGWAKVSGSYYYFNADGTCLVNGWTTYAGKYYYMGANGQIVTNKWIQYGDVWYHVGASGAVDNSWRG